MTIDEFIAEFVSVQQDLIREYHDHEAACHMLHNDLDLGRTQSPGAAELAAVATEMSGQDVPADILDLTTEHHELHAFLGQVRDQGAQSGMTASTLLAAMLVIGRRIGMREAAGMIGSTEADVDLLAGFYNTPEDAADAAAKRKDIEDSPDQAWRGDKDDSSPASE